MSGSPHDPSARGLASIEAAYTKALVALDSLSDEPFDPAAYMNVVLDALCETTLSFAGMVPHGDITDALNDIYATMHRLYPGPSSDDEDDITLFRLRSIFRAYHDRSIAALALPDSMNPAADPLPEKPGMASALAIAAAKSRQRFPDAPIAMEGMKTWYKRLRERYARRPVEMHLWFNRTTHHFEICGNYVQALLDSLPKSRGRPRR